jgi:predicted nucleic acid-binding protein
LDRLRVLWSQGSFEILMHTEALLELKEVLRRPKFKIPDNDLNHLLSTLLIPYTCPALPDPRPLPHPCRDPDDDLFLRLALGGHADALVSGDKALQELDGRYPFPILAPNAFLEAFFPDWMAKEASAGTVTKTRKSKIKKK